MRGLPFLLFLLAAAMPPTALAPTALAQERASSSGSGFVVAEGRALTNHHVIEGCRRIALRTPQGQSLPATVLASDPRRDLAVLRYDGPAGPPLVFRDGPPVARGESVVTYGFPLSGVLSSGPTLTTGDISALAGLRDNPLHYQISAPVQPGNSGGPLLDSRGHVVGVVVSKLNAMRIAQMTGGDIPQNVNFAIKGAEAVRFLRDNAVVPMLAASTGADRRASEVGEVANASTLFIQCFGAATRSAAASPPATAQPGGKPADDPSFRLVNRGQQPVAELFATPAGAGTWGRNRLDQGPLAPQAAHVLRLPRGGACVYDLRVVFADRRALERRGANLCRVTDLPVP
ncbi:MAG: trypsin-like peptidase domain-containing protein [Acetobacteraceae bacterium]|nr:trypsin-like peptidase domain-containing protein [Acetobacteraceae bacterium]